PEEGDRVADHRATLPLPPRRRSARPVRNVAIARLGRADAFEALLDPDLVEEETDAGVELIIAKTGGDEVAALVKDRNPEREVRQRPVQVGPYASGRRRVPFLEIP